MGVMTKRKPLHLLPYGKLGRTRCGSCGREFERVGSGVWHMELHHGARDRKAALIGLEDLER